MHLNNKNVNDCLLMTTTAQYSENTFPAVESDIKMNRIKSNMKKADNY